MSSVPLILIVDDDAEVFQALRRSMHRERQEMIYAASADEALKLLTQRAVDIVIADENMPGTKGSVLLAKVRARWPEVVRMMLTGDCHLETVVSAVNRGELFRFFIKPANEAEIIISIRDALKGRALRRQWERLVEEAKRHGTKEPAESPSPPFSDAPFGPVRST
jgi:DNA-binding NtrC family response regulator